MNTEQKPFVPKTPMDFQKLKLDRLMANPDKLVIIPEMPKEKKGFSVPEFVRNVMGSSAGAGSGEFHVYRHLRRKEYTRQKMIDAKGEKERLDEEYRNKIEENKRKMEEKTAKRRAKRLKRKQKLKQKGTKKLNKTSQNQDEDSSSDCSKDEEDHFVSNEHNTKNSVECNESSQDSFSPENLTHSVISCEPFISKDSIS